MCEFGCCRWSKDCLSIKCQRNAVAHKLQAAAAVIARLADNSGHSVHGCHLRHDRSGPALVTVAELVFLMAGLVLAQVICAGILAG
jgi:hypothetical protein